jgi:hypothetical protein
LHSSVTPALAASAFLLQLTARRAVGLLERPTRLHGENPYKASPGLQTDQAIHRRYFASEPALLSYSTDEEAASKLKGRIKLLYGYPVQVGQTKTRPRQYFARFESGPSTATEVLAESLPLAICRLGLVIALSRDPATQ